MSNTTSALHKQNTIQTFNQHKVLRPVIAMADQLHKVLVKLKTQDKLAKGRLDEIKRKQIITAAFSVSE